MRNFHTFMDSKQRETKEHLHILRQILGKAGFQVSNFLDDTREPYIFVHKPVSVSPIIEGLSFGGVRVYSRGKDIICYRSQNKEHTEPFGGTYHLDVTGIFKDLITEDKDRIGHKIIFYIIKELKDFFVQSAEAEKTGDSAMGAVIMGSSGTGTDYANQVHSPNRS